MGASAPVKYHYSYCFFTYSMKRAGFTSTSGFKVLRGPTRVEDLSGGEFGWAAHLLNHNAGVLRGAHGEQKSPVEQKGKSPLDFDFQCEYKP